MLVVNRPSTGPYPGTQTDQAGLMTTYRPTCGTRWGIAEHARNGEDLCGTCQNADDAARLDHEYRQPIPGTARQEPFVDDLHRVIGLLAGLLNDHHGRKGAAA